MCGTCNLEAILSCTSAPKLYRSALATDVLVYTVSTVVHHLTAECKLHGVKQAASLCC
jgi:hypothetical protein